MRQAELRLTTERQRLRVLLYLGGHIPARVLLAELHGCELMSLLRLSKSDEAVGEVRKEQDGHAKSEDG